MSQLLDASARGVYTISATPFTDSGDIDWPSVDSLVEFYLQCGVQGLTVLGMMGEAQKLSDHESAEFTRHFLRRVNGRVPVIVGVSNPGTANLVKLSRIAMDAGACGVMVAPLTGLKTENQIVVYFAGVQRWARTFPWSTRITRNRRRRTSRPKASSRSSTHIRAS